jgi:hypothetical protein
MSHPVPCDPTGFQVSPPLRRIPIVNVLTDLILGQAVALLNLAFELVAASIDDVQIVVGELAPLLFHLPLACFQFPSTRFQSIDSTSVTKWCCDLRVGERLARQRNMSRLAMVPREPFLS